MNPTPRSRRFYLRRLVVIVLLSSLLVGAVLLVYSGNGLSSLTPSLDDRLQGKWKSTQLVPSEDVEFTSTGEVSLSLPEAVPLESGRGGAPVVNNIKGTYRWIGDKTIQMDLSGNNNKIETVTMEVVILSGATRSSDELRMKRSNGSTRTYRRND